MVNEPRFDYHASTMVQLWFIYHMVQYTKRVWSNDVDFSRRQNVHLNENAESVLLRRPTFALLIKILLP